MFLIYLPNPTTRSEYVLDWIFRKQWGFEYSLCSNRRQAEESQSIDINYSVDNIGSTLHIVPAGLLEDDTLKPWNPEVRNGELFPMLFSNESDTGFDIFSAIFYLLSRYEEYLPFAPDAHGRFPSEASLAHRHGFLNVPVVDAWLAHLKSLLLQKMPSLHFPAVSFSSIFTYDIDAIYRYRGKGAVRWIGGWLRDMAKMEFNAVGNRFRTLLDQQSDPWNVFSHLRDRLFPNRRKSIFFYLVGDKTPMDPNLHFQHKDFKKIVSFTDDFSSTGIHPSYGCMQHPEWLRMEKERLADMLGHKVESSRQHFLRFSLPGSYLELLDAEITEDYSMFYPDAPGFRAGTSRPFYFYDLKNENATPLKIFPGTCMDNTFYKYLKSNPDEALQQMKKLLEVVKRYGGIFIPVFHNEILGLPEWRNLHDQLLEELSLPLYNETDN